MYLRASDASVAPASSSAFSREPEERDEIDVLFLEGGDGS
jgi:hypothetical protein